MNLKVVTHLQKKEKELHRQDQELKFAIINSLKPTFHALVLQLFLHAQFAIDIYLTVNHLHLNLLFLFNIFLFLNILL